MIVNVIVESWLTPTGFGLVIFDSTGEPGAVTVSVAVRAAAVVLPVPLLVVLTLPTVLEFVPTVVLLTLTCIVQLLDAGIVPPVRETSVSPCELPDTTVKVPQFEVVKLGVAVTDMPEGKGSITATPVIA